MSYNVGVGWGSWAQGEFTRTNESGAGEEGTSLRGVVPRVSNTCQDIFSWSESLKGAGQGLGGWSSVQGLDYLAWGCGHRVEMACSLGVAAT